MNEDRYFYTIKRNFRNYEFYSRGPKGEIKKVIRFTRIKSFNLNHYNLAFGDWNEKEKKIDDFTVSNNMDAEKILLTVAAAVLNFIKHYPDALIYARGSTSARTRRYQMAINKYWHRIQPLFDVYGLARNNGFQPFIKNQCYEAFIVKKKK